MRFDGVQLPGSLPLRSPDEAFRTIGAELGRWTRRYADGEIGRPFMWGQSRLFLDNPTLEVVPVDPDGFVSGHDTIREAFPLVRPREDVEVAFERPPHAEVAAASYPAFAAAIEDGALPSGARFLIGISTPYSFHTSFVDPAGWARTMPAFEAQLAAAIAELSRVVPPERLSVQFDVVSDMLVLAGQRPGRMANIGERLGDPDFILDALVRTAGFVPEGVELGYHLCFGDPKGRTARAVRIMADAGLDVAALAEAATDTRMRPGDLKGDLGALAVACGALLERAGRPVDFFHLPIVEALAEARDDGGAEALRSVAFPEATDVYLGLVDVDDGIEGARDRVAAASTIFHSFGISTECGLGRVPREECDEAIAILRELALELDG